MSTSVYYVNNSECETSDMLVKYLVSSSTYLLRPVYFTKIPLSHHSVCLRSQSTKTEKAPVTNKSARAEETGGGWSSTEIANPTYFMSTF